MCATRSKPEKKMLAWLIGAITMVIEDERFLRGDPKENKFVIDRLLDVAKISLEKNL